MPAMPQQRRRELNFTHLRSFRAAASEGGIAAAARRLALSQPTVSEQVAALERSLGCALFERRGKSLVPTEAGRRVLAHAEDVFAAADRLLEALEDEHAAPVRLMVGVVETMPKRVAWKLLEPALALPESVTVECREGPLDRQLAELATHQLDLVLSDTAMPPGSAVLAYNHQLGESGVSWFARSGVVGDGPWPARLDRARVLLPTEGPLRRRLDEWIEAAGLRPRVVARFQDSALLKAAGGAGAGAFPAPSVLAATLATELDVEELGPCEGVTERFFAISPERRIANPAVIAVCRGARLLLETPSRRGH